MAARVDLPLGGHLNLSHLQHKRDHKFWRLFNEGDHTRLRWDRGDKREKKRPPLEKKKVRFDLSKSLGGLRQPPSIPLIPLPPTAGAQHRRTRPATNPDRAPLGNPRDYTRAAFNGGCAELHANAILRAREKWCAGMRKLNGCLYISNRIIHRF